MNIRLTLGEKLRDLRSEKKLTLSNLHEATGIPVPTLQRMENKEDVRVGYQDIAALAKFYNVSTDYLFGLTDNLQHRHIDVDMLRLTDPAIDALKGGKYNNRLVSEMLAHPDFIRLMQSVEIYVDRKIMTHYGEVNDMYKFAESVIRENFDLENNDENIAVLQDLVVDDDGYLRFQISERFNDFLRSLFDAHKKDPLPAEQTGILREMVDAITQFILEPDKECGKIQILTKQMGVDISELSDEEMAAMKSLLRKAEKHMEQADNRRK